MVDGFLGRWSERKQALRQGKAVDDSPLEPPDQVPPVIDFQRAAVPVTEPVAPPSGPPPSLEDAKGLTADSDFKPFLSSEVAPEVRNAAMKKLFADPHFGVMDRLDVYIDDYSQADPLPDSMLRKMASASFLKLFEDEKESSKNGHQTDHKAREAGIQNDHTDLQLQPDHAAGPAEPGRSTE